MFSKLRAFVLSVAVIGLAGCIESKKEVTLNPDGSGKVVYEIKQPLDYMMNISFNGKEQKDDPEEKAKKAIADIIKNSKGVDAWEEVSYVVGDETNLKFKGTAYFKSFNDVKVDSPGFDNSSKVIVDKKGLTITWKKEKKKGMGRPSPDNKTLPVKLSDKELARKVRKTQAEMKQSLAMMGPMLSGFKDEVIFHLPGKIDKFNNFKKVDSNTVSLSFSGEEAIKVMQEFAKDKKAIAESIKAGNDGPSDEYMNKMLFGNEKEIMAHTKNMKTQFDYNKAVKKAKKNFPAMCKKLGVETK